MRTSLESFMIGESCLVVACWLAGSVLKRPPSPVMQASLYSSLVIGSDWHRDLKNLVEKSKFASSVAGRRDSGGVNLA
jgi:hypothetical protein